MSFIFWIWYIVISKQSRSKGIFTFINNFSCGNFVCNETYFRTLSAEIKNRGEGVEKIPILFVHLPPIERISFDRQVILVRTLLKSMIFTPKLDVVGALIKDEFGRVLACRRPPKDQWSGYWEFPGGKIVEGESVHSAVEREIINQNSDQT